jgi:nicotinamidase/pyrazinamidase
MQVDFASAQGALFVPGAPGIVPYIRDEIASARKLGVPVIWSQDWHPEVTKHFALYGGEWPIHCVAESKGAEIIPELSADVRPEDLIIRKGVDGQDGYSAFNVRNDQGTVSPTALHRRLEQLSITHLKICGVATDWCVRSTALDALSLGYSVTLLERGVAGIDLDAGASARSVEEILANGGRIG